MFRLRGLPAVSAIVFTLLLAGCASTQLNYNTLDLASTTDTLLTRQILHNLAKFIDSEASIPSQVIIAAGSASTTNSISPSASFPLSGALSSIETATSMVAATATNTLQRQSTSTRGASGASLAGTDLWQQNWAYAPVSDPDNLHRMRALYLYAVDGDQSALLDRYPLIQRTLKPGDRVADRIFLIKPGCIVCLMDESKPYSRHNITLNETLRGRWLRWHNIGYGIRDDNPPAPGDVPLGTYGGYELYVDGHHPGRFAEFALAVLAAATQSEPSGDDNKGKSGGSSGGKGAGKTAPTFSIQSAPSITIPVQ